MQLYLTQEVCLENLNLLYFIRLLAHVLGDYRLKGYYDCLINHLIVKYEFIEGRLETLDLGALEKDFRAYPALEPLWAVIRMLASNREQLSKICLMIGSVPCVGSVKMNSNPMKNNFGL